MSSPSRPEWDVLLSAAMKNDSDRIQRLVKEQGIPATHANAVGQSALHVAALWGNVQAVQTLLQLGADPRAQNRLSQATPLHMLMQSGKCQNDPNRMEQVVDLLLQACPDVVSMRDQFGCLPLDYYQKQQQQEEQQLISSSLIQKLSPQPPKYFTLVQQGDFETLQQELDSINKTEAAVTCNRSFCGQTLVATALQQLLESCHEDDDDDISNELRHRRFQILQAIVSHGGTFSNEQDKKMNNNDDNESPLMLVLERLRQAYNNNNHSNVNEPGTISTLEVTALLIQKTIKQEQQQQVSSSPPSSQKGATLGGPKGEEDARFLHQAARKNEVRLLQFLIQQLQWDVNMENQQGMTALQFAARSGQVEALQFLLQTLCDKDKDCNNDASAAATAAVLHKNHLGQTALDAAITNDKQEIIQILKPYYNNNDERQNQ